LAIPECRRHPSAGRRGRSQPQGLAVSAERQLRVCRCTLPDGAAGRLQQPVCRCHGNVQILPGNQIPAIPRHRIKASIDYSVTEAFKIGGDALYVSSQYFVGDESNQAPKLQGYTVFNLRASYQIDKTFQVYARVNNVFDNHYATYGTFFDINAIPNLANNGAPFANPDSLSPALPRAFYAGLKATF
jgi:outer membrane receptor protein involved in Fe transport